MRARIVCLTLLGMWALLGVYMRMTDGFGEDGGGRFACVGLLGLAVVVAGIVIESTTARERHAAERANAPAGFPPGPPTLDYASPSRPSAVARPARGSLPALLVGIGTAALLLASMVHFGSEADAASAGMKAKLIALGIALQALAAMLVVRGRRRRR